MTPRSVRILGSEESSFATWGSRPPRAWGRDPQCEKNTNRVGAGLEAAVELLNGDLVGVDLQFLLQLVQILLLLLGLAVFFVVLPVERKNKQTNTQKKNGGRQSRESTQSPAEDLSNGAGHVLFHFIFFDFSFSFDRPTNEKKNDRAY